MLIVTRAEVEALLDPDELIEAVAAALVELSEGRASVPPRVAATVPEEDAWLGAMVAHLPGAGILATKLVSVFPGNAARAEPTHHAVVITFDPATGRPTALVDGSAITAARTAAASALATRLLARPDSRVLAVLGTGVQARAHLRAVTRVRDFGEIRLCGRDPARTGRLADEISEQLGRPIQTMASYEEALRGADVVCAATHTAEPVVRREWLTPGVHVTSVGYNGAGREVDGQTIRDALVVVESREAALAPFPSGANDLLWPIRDRLIGPDHVQAELGELVTGRRPGRTSAQQITLYKSVGVAVEDAAAAGLVLRRAAERGVGRQVDL